MSGAVDLGEAGEEEGEETDMDTGRVGRRPCQRMMRAVTGETEWVETKTITDDDAHLWPSGRRSWEQSPGGGGREMVVECAQVRAHGNALRPAGIQGRAHNSINPRIVIRYCPRLSPTGRPSPLATSLSPSPSLAP